MERRYDRLRIIPTTRLNTEAGPPALFERRAPGVGGCRYRGRGRRHAVVAIGGGGVDDGRSGCPPALAGAEMQRGSVVCSACEVCEVVRERARNQRRFRRWRWERPGMAPSAGVQSRASVSLGRAVQRARGGDERLQWAQQSRLGAASRARTHSRAQRAVSSSCGCKRDVAMGSARWRLAHTGKSEDADPGPNERGGLFQYDIYRR